jgi:MSHA biogenesis protein MshN
VQQNMVVEAETIMVAEENTQSKTDSNHLVDSSNADSPMSLISSAEQKESRQSDDVIQTTNDQSDSTDNQSALGRVEEVKSQPEASFSMSSTSLMAHKKDLKQRIAEQLDAGNQAQGIVLLEQFLVEQPNNINARKKLASLYFAQGRQEQAKLLLSQSVEQYPQRSDFRLMLARILVLEQQQTQAMQWLEELPTTQSNAELLAYRAVLAQQLRKTDLAKQDYAALTRIDPDNGKWWLGLGIAEDKLGNPKQALVAYQSANQTNQLDAVVADFVKTRIDILSESK